MSNRGSSHTLNDNCVTVALTSPEAGFRDRYQRNNKTGGQKHMRCFPQCSNGVHNKSGFCGDSIGVKITETSSVLLNSDIIVLGAFGLHPNQGCGKPLGYDELMNKYDTRFPSCLTYDVMKTNINSVDNPLNPWFSAQKIFSDPNMNALFYEFNTAKRGWHYGWFSTKTTKDFYHYFHTAVYQESNVKGVWNLISESKEGAFQICSTKRAKGGPTATTPKEGNNKLNWNDVNTIDNHNKIKKEKKVNINTMENVTIDAPCNKKNLRSERKRKRNFDMNNVSDSEGEEYDLAQIPEMTQTRGRRCSSIGLNTASVAAFPLLMMKNIDNRSTPPLDLDTYSISHKTNYVAKNAHPQLRAIRGNINHLSVSAASSPLSVTKFKELEAQSGVLDGVYCTATPPPDIENLDGLNLLWYSCVDADCGNFLTSTSLEDIAINDYSYRKMEESVESDVVNHSMIQDRVSTPVDSIAPSRARSSSF